MWFLCHRKEIIRQAAKAFRASGIDFGVISPAKDPETGKKYRFEPEKRVQLASVGSIGRRIADLPSPSLVIWDECQHTPADSWRALRDKTLDAKHVGLTATPERLDGAGLRDLFDDMIVGPSIDHLVADGYLSKYRYFAPSEPDLSAARMRGSDYRREDLDKVMNTPVLIGDAVAEYKKSVPGKRALVFAASVAASKALVERFVSEGIPAAHVDGDTPDDERDAAVADLASGEICVLSNVEVFTEGFDIPAIDAVILMRPTRSLRLLLQMIGRALRVADGKEGAMIFDHAGLYNEHGWFADNWHWSLDGGAAKERRKALSRGPRKCPECKEVRGERVEVCTCGFEFPTGREIGEFDGALREIRGEVPEGCETIYAFCLRTGAPTTSVARLCRNGTISCVDGHPRTLSAEAWLAARSVPHGHVSTAKFAKLHRTSAAVITRWKRRGLPHDSGGFIPEDRGGEWVADNINNAARKMASIAKKGVADGLSTVADFASRYGVSTGLVRNSWRPRGLPINEDGHILLVPADEWVRSNVDFSIVRAMQQTLKKPEGYASQNFFGGMIGVSQSRIFYMCRHGLPYDPQLGIPIREALEWVRDNRPDIVIPPEAWPTADNDNEAATKAA